MPKLLLLDGNSLTYRAFFALPGDMATASGQLTNAVFGFTSMFIYVLKDQRPDQVLIAFDRPEPTFRHEADPTTRPSARRRPIRCASRWSWSARCSTPSAWRRSSCAGYEADDLIATAAEQAVDRGDEVVIVTGDRDDVPAGARPARAGALQPPRGERLRPVRRGRDLRAHRRHPGPVPRVRRAPGRPERQPARRARGGGEDGGQADRHLRRPRRHLRPPRRADAEAAGLAGRARGAGPQEPRGVDPAARRARSRSPPTSTVQPDPAEVKRLFNFLEFRTFEERLAEALGPGGAPRLGVGRARPARRRGHASATRRRHAVDGAACLGLPRPGRRLRRRAGPLAGHRSGGRHRRRLVGGAVGARPTSSPTRRSPSCCGRPGARPRRQAVDARRCSARGSSSTGLELDTAIAAYLLKPADARYDLGSVVEDYTSYAAPAGDAAAAGQLDLGGDQLGDEARAGREALAVSALAEPILAGLEQQGMSRAVPRHREPARRRAGPHGARRRRRRPGRAAAAQRPPHRRRRPPRAPRSRELCGRDDLNVNSTLQLREILFAAPPAGRGLTPVKKTKTGASTDAASLEKLQDQWPEFIGPLLQYRELEKLRGHLRRGPAGRGGARRAHPRHVQPDRGPHRTAQLGPAQPAQHPGPARRGAAVPQGVRPGAGSVLLVADYNQIELRCIAHLARDPGLIAAFTEWPGHPQRHRGPRVRRRAGGRDPRPALQGEDGVLRPRLRHGGVRPRPAPQHPHRGGGGHPRRLLRGVPERQGVHGHDGRRGPQGRLHRDAVRPAPPDPRAARRQLAGAPGRRAPGDERRHPGPGGRHLQGRAGATSTPSCTAPASRPASSCRCTTRSCSRSPRPSGTRSARSWST